MTDEERLVAMAFSEKLNAIGKQVDAVLTLVGAVLLPEGEERRAALLMGKDLIGKANESDEEASRLADAVTEIWQEAGDGTDEA